MIFTFVAGVIMEKTGDAKFVWALTAVLGVLLFISSICLNTSIEKSNEKVLEMSLCERVKFNYNAVCSGLKVRGVTRLLLFLVLAGSVVPNYDEYLYQYMVGPLEMSDFDVSILLIGGMVATLIFLVSINMCCLKLPIRVILIFSIIVQVIGKGTTCLLLQGKTFGLSPLAFLLISDSALG